jgi:hypothetical protein
MIEGSGHGGTPCGCLIYDLICGNLGKKKRPLAVVGRTGIGDQFEISVHPGSSAVAFSPSSPCPPW